MLSKLLALHSLLRRPRAAVSAITRRHYRLEGRKYSKFATERCDAHMNELPIPCGPWEPWYSDKQSTYNKILVGGIVWFFFSLGMMIYTDSIYLNWGPPRNPGPPSDMIEECEIIEDAPAEG